MFTAENFTVLSRDNAKFLPGSWLTCPRKVQFTRAKILHNSYPKVVDTLRSNLFHTAHSVVLGSSWDSETSVITASVDPVIEFTYFGTTKGPAIVKLVTTPGLAARVFVGSFVPRDDLLYAGLVSYYTKKPVNLHYVSVNAYTDVPLPSYKSIAITVTQDKYIEKNFTSTGEHVDNIVDGAKKLTDLGDSIVPRPENWGVVCGTCPYHPKCMAIQRQVVLTLTILKTMGDRT